MISASPGPSLRSSWPRAPKSASPTCRATRWNAGFASSPNPIGAKVITPCDVQNDEDVARVFDLAKETYGSLDFVLHSIAFAPIEDLKVPFVDSSRAGLQDGHGYQRLSRWRSSPGTLLACFLREGRILTLDLSGR